MKKKKNKQNRVGNALSGGSKEEETGAHLLAFGGHGPSEQETHEEESRWETVTLIFFILKTNQSKCLRFFGCLAIVRSRSVGKDG